MLCFKFYQNLSKPYRRSSKVIKILKNNLFISSGQKLTVRSLHLSLSPKILRYNKNKTGFRIAKPMATKQRLLILYFRSCFLRRFNNILKNGVNFEKTGLFICLDIFSVIVKNQR